jgi:hypothetical protein
VTGYAKIVGMSAAVFGLVGTVINTVGLVLIARYGTRPAREIRRVTATTNGATIGEILDAQHADS